MSKNVILLPQVFERALDYFDKADTNLQDFSAFIKSQFNPGNRGLLFSKVKDADSEVNIWSERFMLHCTKATEDQSLRADRIVEIEPFKYHFYLERGTLIQGDWEFLNIDQTNDYIRTGKVQRAKGYTPTEDLLVKEIRSIPYSREKENQFKDYLAYWNAQNEVMRFQEERLKVNKQNTQSDFVECLADFDKGRLIFRLASNNVNYLMRQKIAGCSNSAILSSSGTYEKYGQVIDYDKENAVLYVEPYKQDFLSRIKRKEMERGILWVDETGTKASLNRQKEAIKKLFLYETANPRLRDFVPQIDDLESVGERPLDANLLSDDFNDLTVVQKRAIEAAVTSNDIFLIQGPPGTGKTTVICEIVQYLTKQGMKVLLSSQTHLAVDNVLQRIGNKTGIKAIRIGDAEKFELGAEQFSLEQRVNYLQQSTLQRMEDNAQEVELLRLQLPEKQRIYGVYQCVEKLLKGIVNTIENRKKYLTEREKHQNLLYHDEARFNELGVNRTAFIEQYGREIKSLKILADLQQNSTNQINDNVLAYKLSGQLNMNESNTASIRNYALIIEDMNNEKDSRAELIDKKIGVSLLSESLKQAAQDINVQLEKIIEQANYASPGARVQLEIILGDMQMKRKVAEIHERELSIEMNRLDMKIKKSETRYIELATQAKDLKENVDNFIEMNSQIWSECLGASTITKREFLRFLKNIATFEAEFGSAGDAIESILHLESYKQYLSSDDEYQQLNGVIKTSRKAFNRAESYISMCNDKLEEYYHDPMVVEYLSLRGMELESLTLSEEQRAIRAYSEMYERDSRRVEIYERANSMQQEWIKLLALHQDTFENAYINISNLICATCVGIASSKNNDFQNKEFDYVIIDEAARSSSLELLIPMVRGRRIVLVGDHKQLGAEVENALLEKVEQAYNLIETDLVEDLKKSLFGLMYDRADNKLKIMLNEQFRMCKDISDIVSEYFYDGNLLNGKLIYERNHNLQSYLKNGFYWLDTPETKEFHEESPKSSTSQKNRGEARYVKELLDWLDKKLDVHKSVGIITPYSLQKDHLSDVLKDIKYQHLDLEINTIDAFQGREKNFIILSLVRNNDEGRLGHTAIDSRVNVAISRAQELLIIIGNRNFIERYSRKANKMHAVLQRLAKRNCILDASILSAAGRNKFR